MDMTSRNLQISASILGLAIATQSAPAATYTFQDDLFNVGDWTAGTFADTSTPPATFSVAQVLAGGSTLGPSTPPFRQTSHNYGPGLIRVNQERTPSAPFHWTPLAGESATTIDYSYDLIFPAGSPGISAVGYAPIVRQGGNIFIPTQDQIFNNTWTRFSHLSLPLTSFDEVQPGTGLILSGVNPSPLVAMDFGFLSSNSASGVSTKTSGIDNYDLTLHTVVPEPASTALLALASVAMLARRSRRRRSFTHE